MVMNTKRVHGFLDSMKQRLGYFALAAFFLETSILSWSIRRGMTLQERENKDRIAIGLANYSLFN